MAENCANLSDWQVVIGKMVMCECLSFISHYSYFVRLTLPLEILLNGQQFSDYPTYEQVMKILIRNAFIGCL